MQSKPKAIHPILDFHNDAPAPPPGRDGAAPRCSGASDDRRGRREAKGLASVSSYPPTRGKLGEGLLGLILLNIEWPWLLLETGEELVIVIL